MSNIRLAASSFRCFIASGGVNILNTKQADSSKANTVRCRYNTANIFPHLPNGHRIVFPGWWMCCVYLEFKLELRFCFKKRSFWRSLSARKNAWDAIHIRIHVNVYSLITNYIVRRIYILGRTNCIIVIVVLLLIIIITIVTIIIIIIIITSYITIIIIITKTVVIIIIIVFVYIYIVIIIIVIIMRFIS